MPMVLKALFVHGCPSGHMLDCEEAIEFAKSKGVKYMIVTFPLAEANTAFEHMISGKVRFSSCHAWTALPTGIADKTAIGSFVRESHERTEEQRTLVPQNPDKDDYRTPWREAIYPFWNHVFADVMRWLPQVNCSVGHFHAPAHGVLALGYPSNGDGEGEVKSVRKIWDTNVLLIPAWLDEGVEVRMLSREGEGETTLGTFSAVDTALIWYLKRGTEVEFFIDEAWERERKIAAVLVFGVLCTEGHGEGDADEKDRGDKMNTTDE